MRAQAELLMYGYLRQEYNGIIPNGLKLKFVDYYHILLGFDCGDFGDESVFEKVDEAKIRKTVNDENYSFIFVEPTCYYGSVEARFRILELDNCADIIIGIVTEEEYNLKYVTHKQQSEQRPYCIVAGYSGYTGCMQIAADEYCTEKSKYVQFEDSTYTINDIITLSLDFNSFTVEFFKNEVKIHSKKIEPNVRYKICLVTYSKDIIEML